MRSSKESLFNGQTPAQAQNRHLAVGALKREAVGKETCALRVCSFVESQNKENSERTERTVNAHRASAAPCSSKPRANRRSAASPTASGRVCVRACRARVVKGGLGPEPWSSRHRGFVEGHRGYVEGTSRVCRGHVEAVYMRVRHRGSRIDVEPCIEGTSRVTSRVHRWYIEAYVEGTSRSHTVLCLIHN